MNKIKSLLASALILITTLGHSQAPLAPKTQLPEGVPRTVKYPIITDIERRTPQNLKKEFPYNIVLKDSLGNFFSSKDVLATKGKPLVLMFWMTTCGPCRLELEAMKANFESWQKEVDFRILAISMDFPDRYPNYVERVKKENWPFETVYDEHRQFCDVMPNGGLNGLPQLFVLDEKGEIKYYHRRYIQGDEAELFAELKKLK